LRNAFGVPNTTYSVNPVNVTITPDASKVLVISSQNAKGISVHKATATAWVPLGGQLSEALPAPNNPFSSPLAFNAAGDLIAAPTWVASGTNRIGASLLRWDGATWRALENAPVTQGVDLGGDVREVSDVATMLRSGLDGTLYFSWSEQDAAGATNITIFRENH
jgi:hypothetical protein